MGAGGKGELEARSIFTHSAAQDGAPAAEPAEIGPTGSDGRRLAPRLGSKGQDPTTGTLERSGAGRTLVQPWRRIGWSSALLH
eukprot:413514-Pyramimonas_sp.AAC.1